MVYDVFIGELVWRLRRCTGQLMFPCIVFLALSLVLGCGRSDAEVRTGGVTSGKSAYAALMAENEALRRENQMLRRELISKNGALPDSILPEKGSNAVTEIEPAGKDTGYWMSSTTKVRHNKRCRNYRKVKGYPCGPKDGRPCKTCGG